MKRKITVFIAAAAPLAVVLIAVGCGSSASGSAYSSGPYGSAVKASAANTTSRSAKVGVANSRLGRIVVSSGGRTLYLFEKDSKPSQTKGEGLQDFGGGWEVLSSAGKKIESGG